MPEFVFVVKCSTTKVGEDLRLVGSCPQLGDWSPANGLQLWTTAEMYPLWMSEPISFSKFECEAIECKYVVGSFASGAKVNWEGGPNRRLPSSTKECKGTTVVEHVFGDSAFQEVCGAIPESPPVEEPQEPVLMSRLSRSELPILEESDREVEEISNLFAGDDAVSVVVTPRKQAGRDDGLPSPRSKPFSPRNWTSSHFADAQKEAKAKATVNLTSVNSRTIPCEWGSGESQNLDSKLSPMKKGGPSTQCGQLLVKTLMTIVNLLCGA